MQHHKNETDLKTNTTKKEGFLAPIETNYPGSAGRTINCGERGQKGVGRNFIMAPRTTKSFVNLTEKKSTRKNCGCECNPGKPRQKQKEKTRREIEKPKEKKTDLFWWG